MVEFDDRVIQPLINICRINGDKMIPVISVNNSEIEGLASLSMSAFILRLVCTAEWDGFQDRNIRILPSRIHEDPI